VQADALAAVTATCLFIYLFIHDALPNHDRNECRRMVVALSNSSRMAVVRGQIGFSARFLQAGYSCRSQPGEIHIGFYLHPLRLLKGRRRRTKLN